MEKRRVSIFSFGKKNYPKFSLLINILILFSLVFSLAGIFSCEKQKGVDYQSKSNSPPVISSVIILPEKPYKESELNLSIQSNDPDGDPINYQYQWIRNDEEITGGNRSTLEKGNFKKGDFIRVKVTASDGKVNGAPFLSVPVRILNSPPIVQEVRIEPKVAYVTDRLKTSVKSIDPDGDFIYYTYRWEKNGVVINDENGDFFERGRFKKGDSIAVIVTPDDRETVGTPKKSEPLVISNSPPLIVSSPPPSVEKTTHIYQVAAKDPDGDPMTFHLRLGPKGMKIDPKTGLIEWEIGKEDKGSHSVEIEVSDDAGAKSIQRYTLTIDFK